MTFQVWIWPFTDEPKFEPAAGPGPGWQKVGEVSSDGAPAIVKAVQRRLGLAGGSDSNAVVGWVEGYADHEWVRRQAAAAPEPFAIAFGPVGHVGDVYLLARARAEVITPSTRAPEPHPGLTSIPLYFGIRMIKHNGAMLDRLG